MIFLFKTHFWCSIVKSTMRLWLCLCLSIMGVVVGPELLELKVSRPQFLFSLCFQLSETFPENAKKLADIWPAMWSPYPHPQVQLVKIHTPQVHTHTHTYMHTYTSHSIKTKRHYNSVKTGFNEHTHTHSEVLHTIKVPHTFLLGGNVINVLFFWAPWPLTLLLSTVSFYFLCILLLCLILMMDFFMQCWLGWFNPSDGSSSSTLSHCTVESS